MGIYIDIYWQQNFHPLGILMFMKTVKELNKDDLGNDNLYETGDIIRA